MIWYDWLILVIPVCFVMYMGIYSRKYIRGVSDFLSAGRICGRYVICVGDLANALSIIGLATYIEMHYKTGFSVSFWSSILAPLSIVLSLTGFCVYRFRETKAMSLGQFLEMRYSRKFRIFAAGLRSLSEMLANMIMPAIAARFFIRMLDLPDTFKFLGIPCSTYVVLMLLFLTLAITLICCGGTLSLIVTDSIQGMLLYPILLCFVIFIFYKFNFTTEIMPVMADRIKGESFLNPYDISKLRDFNFFSMVIVAAYSTVMNRANWIGAGYSTAAKTPQEQKMAGLLGGWRSTLVNVYYILISCALITFLNHKDFAQEANIVRRDLAIRSANDVFKNDMRTRDLLKDAIEKIEPQYHEIGQDKPLSQNENLDSAFLDKIHTTLKDDARTRKLAELENSDLSQEDKDKAVIDAEGIANDKFQQCRTLYNQLNLSVTMRQLLPHGLFGLFALLLFLAMLSTDDTRIYSAALTIAQDVVLPLRKKPFTPEQHVWMIRIVAICIGVFFLCGSYFMRQLDFINMFVQLVTSMFTSGAGAVMVFGLYSSFGTTAGAWTALLTSAVMSTSYIFIQRNWANIVYPAIAKAGLVETCDKILRTLSKPFGDWITWTMNEVKCPVNSIEFAFFLSLMTVILYVIVSKCTCDKPFNLERMLHRGKYGLNEQRNLTRQWTPKTIFKNIIGITPEYSKGDRFIAYGIFCHSFVYGFCFCFLGTVIWNAFFRWPIEWWSRYFIIIHFIVPGIIAVISTFWFGIGGFYGLMNLFHDLDARKETNILDDGRVEGTMSLADKEALEALDKETDDKKNTPSSDTQK